MVIQVNGTSVSCNNHSTTLSLTNKIYYVVQGLGGPVRIKFHGGDWEEAPDAYFASRVIAQCCLEAHTTAELRSSKIVSVEVQ